MTVVRSTGTIAGPDALKYIQQHRHEVDQNGVTFWVCGHNVTLESDSYNSCVGMVLHGDVEGYGAVAHFWAPTVDLLSNTRRDAEEITEAYMHWLLQQTGGYAGDDVEAVVFGGKALKTATGDELTVPRIKAIREFLEDRWDMRVVVATVGSQWVKLDLTIPAASIEDRVTLEKGLAARKPHEFSTSPKSKTKGHKRTGSSGW